MRGVTLLPYFDAYGVGSFPRELLFPGKAFTRATARGQAGNYPLLLVDGIVAGVWHQKKAGRKLHVTVEAMTPLSRTRRRRLDAEVDRLGCDAWPADHRSPWAMWRSVRTPESETAVQNMITNLE